MKDICIEISCSAVFEIEPFVPGCFSGPPEGCYPDEGGFARLFELIITQYDHHISCERLGDLFGPGADSLIEEMEAEAYCAWEAAQV